MPTITLHRGTFEKLVGKKLTTNQLKEKIPMIGTALEEITDKEIVVEVFPNRPDMLSEQGFARAFRSFLGVKTGLSEFKVKKSGFRVTVDSSVTMRPYTACAIVKNLSFDDERIREVMQIQEKLATTHGRNRKKSEYGVYPLDRVKFPITYKALDPNDVSFQPLGFDKPVKASLIADQHPKGKEYKHLATGWKKHPFFLDADGNIMAMIPFTNSQDTGRITEKTRDVFVECDGTDLKNVTVALNIITAMLADMGGDVYSVDVVYGSKVMTTPDFTPRKMKLDHNYVNKRLGTALSAKDVEKCLAKMGHGVGKDVLVPAYRADILHSIDLVEDVAIAHGYDSIEPTVPHIATIAEENVQSKFTRKVVELFVGLGFQEAASFHLMAHTELTTMMCKPTHDVVHLKNSLVDYGCMRNSIVPSLLKILAQNQHNEYPQNIFEHGRTFHVDKSALYGIRESRTLAVSCSGETVDFTTVRRVVDTLVKLLRVDGKIVEASDSSFIAGRTAALSVGGKRIALFGEIHPAVLEQWNIAMPVAAIEIDLDGLFGCVLR